MYLSANDTEALLERTLGAAKRKVAKPKAKAAPVRVAARGAAVKVAEPPDPVTKIVKTDILPLLNAIRMRIATFDPGASGKLALRWTVTPEGMVSGLRVLEDRLPSRAFKNSVYNVISKWRFPKMAAPRDVTVPLVFAGAGEEADLGAAPRGAVIGALVVSLLALSGGIFFLLRD